ncbi:hypothetical protein K503DRAFT_858158 [Rhizopogon vinicolor AM-OR11-026]|uniref:Transmembrane protein n=1 Tax=Rhizopogon vinicolor AM-OR11-026 TaxID=1314800 RepID=A0A1B7MUA8_9AGAM|nr:hypothetical protein K503DRAFT_858158 [Rhizopogon vinicolor AM-OR11-026]
MLGYDAPSFDTVRDTSTPPVSEFLKHPDHRQIASFFLGYVFICSLLCIMTSSVMRRLYRRCSKVFALGRFMQSDARFHNENSAPWDDVENSIETLLRDDQRSRIMFLEDENRDLVLMLYICFAFASIAYFSSLLSFNSSGGSSACAFVVAWGGISAACGRFVGLVILSLDLRKFALRRWELCLAWSWLVVSAAFVFATYAVSVGKVAYVLQLGTYLCYRTIYLPTALTMSLIFVTLELYIIGRLLSFIAPPFLEVKHRIGAVTDTRVLRALSLLLLELFCLVPGVKFIGIVGEFVPFSIGALIVLAMFHKHRPRPILGEPMPVPPMSLRGSRAPTIRISIHPSLSRQPHMPGHPFAAPMQSSPTSHIYRASVASSISFSGYSYTASPSFKTEVVKITSKSKYTQSRPQLLDSAGTVVSLVSSRGHSGVMADHTRTYSEPLRVLPRQVEFANGLEPLQDLSSRGSLSIRPRIKIPKQSLGSDVQPDEWSTVGHCNLSPTTQKTFDDQSLQSFVPQTSVEQSLASVPSSSILLKRSTFGEQSFSVDNLAASQRFIRRLPSLTPQVKTAEDDSPIDSSITEFATYRPALTPVSGVRIRGPRPPPKVFYQSNPTPTASSLVAEVCVH